MQDEYDIYEDSDPGPISSGPDFIDTHEGEECECESELSGSEGSGLDGQAHGPGDADVDVDFERLVRSIRTADDISSTGLLQREWDIRLEDQDALFRDDLREASGIGKRKRKQRERRVGPVLSHQVRTLIGEGNQAYIDNNLTEAIRVMQEVIRIEPRAIPAWTVLAQCYEDKNEPQKALQLRIMAAHLRRDAEEWERLARQSRDLGFNQQALYCYTKLYSLDPENVDALWDRASLAREMRDLRTARHSLLAILKRFPHDITVLTELRPILIELADFALCATLYQDALEYNQTLNPLGHALDPSIAGQIEQSKFGFIELLVLADLHNTTNEYERAIDTIRKGCRWLQGRATQKFWDVCEDDREYDLPSQEGAEPVHRAGDVQPGYYPLDINSRHRLAVARIKMGDTDEGKMHANIVLSEDALDYAVLIAEIADAYFELEMYSAAGPIYETLGADPATSSLYVLLQVATCRRMQGDIREASEVYKQVIDADPSNTDAKMKLAELYEIMDEPRKALELVYQVIDARKRRPGQAEGTALPGVPSSSQAGASLFDEKSHARSKGRTTTKSGRLTLADLKVLEEQREREVLLGYKRIEELWPRVLSAESNDEVVREWMLEAEKLVEMFRETRNLFLTSRHNGFRGMFPRRRQQRQSETEEERMASRLELIERDKHLRKSKDDGQQPEKVDSFRGVSFENWLRLFMQYTFILTRRGEYELADEVLRHILMSNGYRSKEKQVTIRLAIITCAMAVENYAVVVEQCRKLINVYQFNNEPMRLLLSSLASGLRPTDSFISSTLQKHMLREVRLSDGAVKTPELLKWNNSSQRYHLTVKSAGDDEAIKGGDAPEDDAEDAGDAADPAPTSDKKPLWLPTKNNPLPVTLYGQLCLAAKSYQSAIFYLLHGYDYCQEDPIICLCLALSSLGRAMQRQADNRNHLIAQGMACLSQYRAARRQDGEHVLPEIEFNFGRAFQQLGLHTLAVTHYEKVLQLAEERKDDDVSVAREAAYNLSLIYVTTGATPLAEALYRRWLSV
ncbi:TPR-like protein [Imleria badia]|nr:TPR-like protein [Imleria badia]